MTPKWTKEVPTVPGCWLGTYADEATPACFETVLIGLGHNDVLCHIDKAGVYTPLTEWIDDYWRYGESDDAVIWYGPIPTPDEGER